MKWRRQFVPLFYVPLTCITLFLGIYYKVWTFQLFAPYVLAAMIGGIAPALFYGFKRNENIHERETLTTSAVVQEQTPSLTYGRIIIRHSEEHQHDGTYHDSTYLLEILNTIPNATAINCQASLDLHNNPEIRDFVAIWNKNKSDKISVGHRELLRLFTVSLFYKGNRRFGTRLLFDKKSDIEGVFNYWQVPYTESLNRELRVLLQSENARYPLTTEAFARTIQFIMDNAIGE